MAKNKHQDGEPDELPEPEEVTAEDLLEDTNRQELDVDALLQDSGDTESRDMGTRETLPAAEEVTAEDLLAEEPTEAALIHEELIQEELVQQEELPMEEGTPEDVAAYLTEEEDRPTEDVGVMEVEDVGVTEEGAPGKEEAFPLEVESGSDEATVPVGPTKKIGKKKFGKAKDGEKTGPVSKAPGKGKLKEAKKPAREKRVKPAPEERKVAVAAAHGSIPFICSECYEEFLLPNNYSRDTMTCPECLHVGKRPDEDFVRKVTLQKAGERTAFTVVLLAGLALLLVVLSLIWVRSPYRTLELEPDTLKNVTYGLLGAAVILAGVLFWRLAQYEGKRWEVYF
jgi:hypothetical protein